jgi:hypothetical protein
MKPGNEHPAASRFGSDRHDRPSVPPVSDKGSGTPSDPSSAAHTESEDVCETCDGDGYTESFNADQTDVVITLCTDCGPAPGDFDA